VFSKIRVFYAKWVRFGKKAAAFQIRLLFTLVYFIFFIPFSLIVKLFSKKKQGGWKSVAEEPADLDHARRQF